MQKTVSYATVKDGAIIVRGLGSLEGKKVEVTVQKLRKRRSNPQNAFYWAVVVEYFWQGLRDLGHEVSKDDAHEILKLKFLKTHVMNDDTGEVIEFTKSTSALTTSEFMDFIAQCQQYAMETCNVNIPDPNQFMQEAAL